MLGKQLVQMVTGHVQEYLMLRAELTNHITSSSEARG